ncbi:MAG TPA: alpha-glucan family phosphorylase [Nitrospirae bacterium]|nr:alpha-glucan family phosphorylase [Nitrospirota bacterium]
MNDESIAYFSMEIALDEGMPTYAGGLGVLAGDTIRSAADLGIPMVAITLLYRKGYFRQRLEQDGWQQEEPVQWNIEDFLQEVPRRTAVMIEGRTVHLRAWKYEVKGLSGHIVPVYLLDTDLPENSEWDRTLTHYLYGGDHHYRLCQEVILGIGGVKMLRATDHHDIKRFHMNEGHAALLTLELLDEKARSAGRDVISRDDIEAVRRRCVFTTHTPVPAGHDQFSLDLVAQVLQRDEFLEMKDIFCLNLARHVLEEGKKVSEMEDVHALNMTYLALNLSHYVNGVAKRHGEVSRMMFKGFSIDSITNGVHAATWASPPFQELFDRYIPGWRQDNFSLRKAFGIPKTEVFNAHRRTKETLINHVNQRAGAEMDMEIFTVGFARRATPYKRLDLFFTDIGRLKAISKKVGKLQVICAGKAHPQDTEGKELIKRIFRFREELNDHVRVVYLQDYDLQLAKMIVAGVDLWLNTPHPPMEASGTSGMKAALNGVPSLSVLDGWWLEGHIENVTGWSIGERNNDGTEGNERLRDAQVLYDKLEYIIIPMFYENRERYIEVMRHAIAFNGSFFNTQRMMQQYVLNAYFR